MAGRRVDLERRDTGFHAAISGCEGELVAGDLGVAARRGGGRSGRARGRAGRRAAGWPASRGWRRRRRSGSRRCRRVRRTPRRAAASTMSSTQAEAAIAETSWLRQAVSRGRGHQQRDRAAEDDRDDGRADPQRGEAGAGEDDASQTTGSQSRAREPPRNQAITSAPTVAGTVTAAGSDDPDVALDDAVDRPRDAADRRVRQRGDADAGSGARAPQLAELRARCRRRRGGWRPAPRGGEVEVHGPVLPARGAQTCDTAAAHRGAGRPRRFRRMGSRDDPRPEILPSQTRDAPNNLAAISAHAPGDLRHNRV